MSFSIDPSKAASASQPIEIVDPAVLQPISLDLATSDLEKEIFLECQHYLAKELLDDNLILFEESNLEDQHPIEDVSGYIASQRFIHNLVEHLSDTAVFKLKATSQFEMPEYERHVFGVGPHHIPLPVQSWKFLPA